MNKQQAGVLAFEGREAEAWSKEPCSFLTSDRELLDPHSQLRHSVGFSPDFPRTTAVHKCFVILADQLVEQNATGGD